MFALSPAQRVIVCIERTRLATRAVAAKIRDKVFSEENARGKKQLSALAKSLLARFLADFVGSEGRSPTVVFVSSRPEAELV